MVAYEEKRLFPYVHLPRRLQLAPVGRDICNTIKKQYDIHNSYLQNLPVAQHIGCVDRATKKTWLPSWLSRHTLAKGRRNIVYTLYIQI